MAASRPNETPIPTGQKPGRQCATCTHKQLDAIENAIIGGDPLSVIARTFKEVSRDSLRRHAREHMAKRIASHQSQVRKLADEMGVSAVDQIEWARAQLRLAALRATIDKNHGAAISALGKILGTIELELKVKGEMPPEQHVHHVVDVPGFPRFVSLVMDLIAPFPEASAALKTGLRDFLKGSQYLPPASESDVEGVVLDESEPDDPDSEPQASETPPEGGP